MQLEYIVESTTGNTSRPLVHLKMSRPESDKAICEQSAIAWFREVSKRSELNDSDLALIEVNEAEERRQVTICRASERNTERSLSM